MKEALPCCGGIRRVKVGWGDLIWGYRTSHYYVRVSIIERIWGIVDERVEVPAKSLSSKTVVGL